MLTALAFVLLAAPAVPNPEAVFFEQTATTTVDGTAATPVRSRVYWRGHDVRLEAGDAFSPTVLLLDLANDRATRLDPLTKTAIALNMADLRARTNLGFSMAGDAVGADDADRIRSSELEGVRTIAGYVCQGHRIRSGNTRIDVWTSRAVKVPMEMFSEFLEWSGAAQSLGGLLPELERLGGFPLETRSHFTVQNHTYDTVATITQIKTDPLPASLFAPPAGYRMVLAPEEAEDE